MEQCGNLREDCAASTFSIKRLNIPHIEKSQPGSWNESCMQTCGHTIRMKQKCNIQLLAEAVLVCMHMYGANAQEPKKLYH